MREQVIHAVNMYIDAVRRNDASAAPLHPDMIAEFPTNTYHGAVSFRHIHVVNREIVFVRGYCDPRPMFSATNAEEQDKS